MTLLREIQEAAIDEKTPIAVLLRRCMVLATRLGNERFKAWVDAELNGYEPDAELPRYRRVGGISSIGHFAGGGGAQLTNVPLALSPIPADHRERYRTAEFRDAAAKVEHMAGDTGELVCRWPGDLV